MSPLEFCLDSGPAPVLAEITESESESSRDNLAAMAAASACSRNLEIHKISSHSNLECIVVDR